MANTPYMNLALPIVSSTIGPTWATQLNTALAAIDAHNHTTGNGVAVPSVGLNINAALPFNNNDAIALRSTRFTDQTSPLTAPADVGCLYLAGGNLFFNSGAGAAVQITSGVGLAGTPGSIGGLVSPAAVTYTPASTTFRFTANTNINAQLDIAQLTIRQPIAAANGITIQSPLSLASSYSITLPTALPAGQRILTLDNAGAMSFWNIDGTTIVNNAGTLSVAVAPGVTQTAANTSATIKGNRSAADTGADVVSNGSATRTAGYIHAFQNNGTTKTAFDFNGNLAFQAGSGTIYTTTAGGQMVIKGNLAAASGSGDVISQSTNTRTAGNIHEFWNNGVEKAAIGYDGSLYTSTGVFALGTAVLALNSAQNAPNFPGPDTRITTPVTRTAGYLLAVYANTSQMFAVNFMGGICPSSPTAAGSGANAIYMGGGAPAFGTGQNGDFYFNAAATGAGTYIYFKSGGAWGGIV